VTGLEMIAAERKRQIEVEGWTPEHDAEHVFGEMTLAAICYAEDAKLNDYCPSAPQKWPWAREWWKPASPIRMLVKAGALLAAEIDRRLACGEMP